MTDEKQQPEAKLTTAADITAIQRISRILDGLKPAERDRVMQFVWERYFPKRLYADLPPPTGLLEMKREGT